MPCERKHIEASRDAFFGLRVDEASRLVESGTGRLAVAIHAALAACDESPWRSMESAPKDGEAFLAVVDGEVRKVAWTKTSHVPLWWWCLVDQGAEDCDICEPSLWMPRPAAPEVKL